MSHPFIEDHCRHTMILSLLMDLQEEQLSILRNKPNGALLTLEDLNNMSYASKVRGTRRKKFNEFPY